MKNNNETNDGSNSTPIFFLGMNSKTAGAVLACRPELKKLKEGANHRVLCRKLGKQGDPSIKQMAQGELDGATVIGFSIPVNVSARAKQAIEIPVGNAIERKKLADALNDSEMESLSKALAEYVRIPLKAFVTRTEAIILPESEDDEEKEAAEEDEVAM